MDQVNVRLGYTAPVRPKTTPWGLLAWYLSQIDEVADAPGFTVAVPSDPARRGGGRALTPWVAPEGR